MEICLAGILPLSAYPHDLKRKMSSYRKITNRLIFNGISCNCQTDCIDIPFFRMLKEAPLWRTFKTDQRPLSRLFLICDFLLRRDFLMIKTGDTLYRDLVVVNELGLHARSAAKIAQVAAQAQHGVWLEKDADRVDAKQVIDILTLAAMKGDTVRLLIDAPGDEDILDQIDQLFINGFGE
jgi:phosphocarrier protein